MMSYGDPDLDNKWSRLRLMQDAARAIDEAAYPDDPDVPGLTFLSPVEWAPWMETIWFGNQYEYRSAYFHDAMYSNNMPFREGALLYSDQRKALEVALLYQRYKKFDMDSYSLPNATFFNIFGAESLRVGRYKVPQGDSVILCTTDPLTFTEMRRYFNSLAPLKWFRSKFMQQKRKRQFIMNIGAGGDGSDVGVLVGGGRDGGSFFSTCVHKIEHGQWEESDIKKNKLGKGQRVPVLPIDSASLGYVDDSQGQGGLCVPTNVANSQYFIESLVHNVLVYASRATGEDISNLNVYMGGDGRLLNSFATELALRVMTGDGVKRVRLAKRGTLTTSEAISTMESKKGDMRKKGTLALVWTATDRKSGLRGCVGLQLVLQKQGETQTPFVVDREGWANIGNDMSKCSEVGMVSKRPSAIASPVERLDFCGMDVRPFSPPPKLLASLQSEYDFPALRSFLEKSGLHFTVDCLHGGGGPSMKRVLKELGLDPSTVLMNEKPSVGSGVRDPFSPSGESMELFSVPTMDIERILAYPIVDVGANLGVDDDEVSIPDAGFVFDANAQRCAVLTRGLRASALESDAVLSSLPERQRRPSCAVRSLLGWLTILAKDPETVKAPSEGILREVQRVWQSSEGRKLSLRLQMKVEESQAVEFINRLRDLQTNPNRDWSSVDIKAVGSSNKLLALDALEPAGKQTVSPLVFARSARVILTAGSSDTALGIADLSTVRVDVSVEGLQEKENTREDSDEDQDSEDEEDDDWETRRGLLGAAMQATEDEEIVSKPSFATVCLDMAVKIRPAGSTSLTRSMQTENEIWGRILKNLRDIAPDSPLIIEDIEVDTVASVHGLQ